MDQVQRFLCSHAAVYNLLNLGQQRVVARNSRFQAAWL